MTNEINKSRDLVGVSLPAVPTRRGIIRAGAWAMPVVASVSALPLAAASDPTGPVVIELLGGDDPFEGEEGDTVSLVFRITQGGVEVNGEATATLVNASGIAAWTGIAGDALPGAVDEGIFLAEAEVLGHGSFLVTVAYGSTEHQFTVVFE